MPEDMSILQGEIARLTKENVLLHQENKQHRLRRKKAVEELGVVKLEHESVTKQLDEFKNVVSTTPDEWQTKYETLKGEVVAEKHKGAFVKLAKELKVRDEAVDDLFTLSGYKPEGDEPNEAALKGLIQGVVQARPYLLAPETPSEPVVSGVTKPATLPPGPGLSRPSLEPTHKTQVRKEDMRSATFMKTHQKAIAEGLKAGTMEII